MAWWSCSPSTILVVVNGKNDNLYNFAMPYLCLWSLLCWLLFFRCNGLFCLFFFLMRLLPHTFSYVLNVLYIRVLRLNTIERIRQYLITTRSSYVRMRVFIMPWYVIYNEIVIYTPIILWIVPRLFLLFSVCTSKNYMLYALWESYALTRATFTININRREYGIEHFPVHLNYNNQPRHLIISMNRRKTQFFSSIKNRFCSLFVGGLSDHHFPHLPSLFQRSSIIIEKSWICVCCTILVNQKKILTTISQRFRLQRQKFWPETWDQYREL